MTITAQELLPKRCKNYLRNIEELIQEKQN